MLAADLVLQVGAARRLAADPPGTRVATGCRSVSPSSTGVLSTTDGRFRVAPHPAVLTAGREFLGHSVQPVAEVRHVRCVHDQHDGAGVAGLAWQEQPQAVPNQHGHQM